LVSLTNANGNNDINIEGPGYTGGTLTFTDDMAGVDLSGSPITVAAFQLHGDSESTLTNAAASDINGLNTFQTVFDFDINDLDNAAAIDDEQPTVVDVMAFTVAVSNVNGGGYDATDFDWQVLFDTNNDGTPDTVATAATGVAAGTVTFTVATLVSVTHNSTFGVFLQARFNNTDSATIDNETLTISTSTAQITTNQSGSRIAGAQTATNGGNTDIQVVASQMRFIGANPSTSPTNTAIAVDLEFVDARGHRDRDVTETVTVTWSGGGTPANNTKAATAGLVDIVAGDNFNISDPGDLNGTLTFADDGAAGPGPDLADITITNFDLVDPDDEDTNIVEMGTGPATLDSQAALTAVFAVNFVDSGRSDGKPTIVNSVTYDVTVSGAMNDTSDFQWQLFNGAATFAPSATTATTVTFTDAPLISVANGMTGTLTLRARVTSTNSTTIDNATIDIVLTEVANITEAGGATSTTVTATDSVDNATNTAVVVAASTNRFVSGQTPTSPQIINDNFTGQIEYVDADGNRDLDSTDTITVSFNANTINSPAGGMLAATSGLVDFSGGN
ncbi:MAG: hypothetical protein KDB07_08845, partial [Planctomycetes bacterium]|nr:hypothetical protein [Planctomycetota bacterium]